jgi:hypothetical protein
LGLLIEEQRTNTISNNTGVGAVAGTPGTLPTNWLAPTSFSGLSREIVSVGVESGISYVDVRYFGTANASTPAVISAEGFNTVAAVNGQTWSHSMFLKVVGGTLNGIVLRHDLRVQSVSSFLQAIGLIVSVTPTSAPLLEQRTVSTGTITSEGAAFIVGRLLMVPTEDAAIDITLRIGLPQLEQGAFATSPILTTTAAATRAADVAVMTGANFSSWYNQSQGTLFAEAAILSAGYTGGVLLDIGSASAFGTSLYMGWSGTGWSLNPSIAPLSINSFVSGTVSSKVAAGLAVNDSVISANGVLGNVDPSCNLPSVATVLSIGKAGWTSSNFVNGHIRKIAFYPKRLANDQLQGITTV